MTEIERAEAALRRGIGFAFLAGLGFWAVVMLVVALGMAR